jgi:hypothetical protein
MKKLIPLMVALGITFGAVTAFSHSNSGPQAKNTKATKKPKATKK